MSLAGLIAWVAEDSVARELLREVLFRVASNISTIVLQFYSMPWLRETWRSKDTHLVGLRGSEQSTLLESLFLNGKIPERCSLTKSTESRDAPANTKQDITDGLENLGLKPIRRMTTQDVAP